MMWVPVRLHRISVDGNLLVSELRCGLGEHDGQNTIFHRRFDILPLFKHDINSKFTNALS